MFAERWGGVVKFIKSFTVLEKLYLLEVWLFKIDGNYLFNISYISCIVLLVQLSNFYYFLGNWYKNLFKKINFL